MLEQQYPIAGSGSGVWSWVHVEDAASATVAALECPAGVYNIVDDDPSAMSVWLPAFAASVGAPEPQHISEREAFEQAGPDDVYYATRLRGAFKRKGETRSCLCAKTAGMARLNKNFQAGHDPGGLGLT